MALAYRVGVGDADRQLVLQQNSIAALQSAEHATLLSLAITGLHTPEVSTVGVALAGVAAEAERLQVADVVRAALVPGENVVHLQGPLMLMGTAALVSSDIEN